MALARLALRLAMIEALRADPVIAAVVQGQIYDSRVQPMEDMEASPAIIVSTEDDAGEADAVNNGGPYFRRAVALQVEIGVQTFRRDPDSPDDQPQFLIAGVETSAALDAALDLIEERVLDVFQAERAASRTLRLVCKRPLKVSSERYVQPDGTPLAQRLVTVDCLLITDTQPALHPDDVVAPDPQKPFAHLPQPLRGVAEALPSDSPGRRICASIAALWPAPVADPEFEGADITTNVVPKPTPAP